MARSQRIAAEADPPDAQPAWSPPARFQLPVGREHRWLRRLLGATPWIVGCMALFAFYLRISFTGHVSSDGANSALQAWDMLHGHLLLHGWIIGDATYYTFDLPVLALTELFSGLSNLTSHVASDPAPRRLLVLGTSADKDHAGDPRRAAAGGGPRVRHASAAPPRDASRAAGGGRACARSTGAGDPRRGGGDPPRPAPAGPGDLIVVAGSLYVVAEARAALGHADEVDPAL